MWLIFTLTTGQELHAQWEIKNPGTNYLTSYANIFVQDSKTAFLLPADGFARILRTRDAGETWEERVLPSHYCGSIDVMRSTGELNLWAGNALGMVVHSADGGDSWESYFFSSPVLSISFFDSLTGWILTEDQKLRFTTNGGKTWDHFTCPYKNVFAVNENTLLAGNGITYAFVSNDKGNTWEYLAGAFYSLDPEITKIFYSEPCNRIDSYRLNTSGLYSSRERYFYNIEKGGKLYDQGYSVNPSHRWLAVHSENLKFSADGQYYSELPLKIYYPDGIGFFDENNGLLISDHTVYKSKDGGQSWQSSMVLRNKRENLVDLIFTSPNEAFLLGVRTDLGIPENFGLYRSQDGGNTWASFYQDGLNQYGAMALLDGHLFMAGKGTVFRIHTVNKQVNTQSIGTEYLNDIVFFGDGIGIVCGEKGSLFRSEDRGQTWIKIPMSDQLRFFQLEVIEDGKIIQMSGPTGYILQSLDSGKSWGQVLLPDSTAFSLGMHFINSDTGVVIGYDISNLQNRSSLFRTYDGGLNWDKFQISMANMMSGMGIVPYMMDDAVLIGTGDGIERLDPYSINFETEYSRGFGGPSVFRKDSSGGLWAVCNWSTLLKRETMGTFSLLAPANNSLVKPVRDTKVTLEWEKVTGAYEYRFFLKNKDSILEKTVGDLLRYNSQGSYQMHLDDIQFSQVLSDLGLDPVEGSLEWTVWAINTKDTIKIHQYRTLNYHMEKDPDPGSGLFFDLVPNPADDHVFLQFDKRISEDVTVHITDAGGKNIQTRTWEKCACGYIYLETDHLSQGVYFITLVKNNVRASAKLVIAR